MKKIIAFVLLIIGGFFAFAPHDIHLDLGFPAPHPVHVVFGIILLTIGLWVLGGFKKNEKTNEKT